MKIKTTLAIAALAFVGTAFGKDEATKPSKPAQAPQSSSAKADSGQKKAPEAPATDTAADGGPRLKKGSRW